MSEKADVVGVEVEQNQAGLTGKCASQAGDGGPAIPEYFGPMLLALVQDFLRKLEVLVFLARIGGGEIEQEWGLDNGHFDGAQLVVAANKARDLKLRNFFDLQPFES